jgi:outer membrane receptor protein involved in Fe transport
MTRSKRRKMQRSTGVQLAYRAVRTAPIASAVLLAAMSTAYGQETTTAGGLEEIIVTAQKREESMQDVPLAIQAIGTQRLQELNVSSFDDFVRFLPSVSYQTSGPGSARIYMRGVASGGDGNHSASLPSVGMYLDEQPITTIIGPLDIHMYDIQRVEALAGPQGTLFGSSSQAGTIRVITNKPDTTGFDGGYGVELNSVVDGDLGYLGEGFVNVPITDAMAVRLVGWVREDAGYIDNVRSTRVYPTSLAAVDNSRFVEEDYNNVTTYGGRAALRIELNDSWTVTPTVMGQMQESNGYFGYDRLLGPNKVAHARPETFDDNWVQAALTVEGKVANFDMVYAGAYMVRDVDGESDYQDYSYWYDELFGSGAYWVDNNGDYVSDPGQYIQGQDNFTKQSHELRFSSPQDQRLRYTVGAFYQKSTHGIEQRYRIEDLADSLEVEGWPDTIWLTQQDREDVDYAIFGQAEFDIVDRLTATFGMRYFWAENSLKGFFGFGTGYPFSSGTKRCTLREPFGADGPNFEDAPCLNLDKEVEEDDYGIKLGLSYKFTEDKLIYANYAEGFRPGGINRRAELPPYLPDFLDSYEIGWKTSWADNTLRFNGALFYQVWDDFQFPLLGLNGLTEIKNAAEAEITGIEADVVWAPIDGLSLTAAVSFLDSELAKPYCGYVDPSNNQPVATDPCPTFDEDTGLPDGNFQEPEAPEGQRLPVTPEFKGNITARYEFPVAAYDSYVQGALVYVGERESDLRTAAREQIGQIPSYTTFDFAGGLGGDGWNLELFVTNLFDEEGELDRTVQCPENVCGDQQYAVITQPRTIGLRFSQSF